MMLEDLLRPLSPENFLRDHWTRGFLHLPGDPAKFKDLFSWDALNTALETHRFDEKRLALFKSGAKLDAARYLNGHYVDARKLTNELSNGAALIVNGCEEVWPPLRDLCLHLEVVISYPRDRKSVRGMAGAITGFGRALG